MSRASWIQAAGASVLSVSVGMGWHWWAGGLVAGSFLIIFGVAMERGSD